MQTIQKAFGLAVRKYRYGLGLSQEEFAEKAGIHRTYVSDIELGKVSIGLSVAQKLASVFGLKLSELIKKAEKY
ncbi:MAG: helix-turn-helix transcriptional regulator [Candidatus Omnitrophota bacterium]